MCPYWSHYGSADECSVTCGGGVSARSRYCVNGMPGMQGCEGDSILMNACNEQVFIIITRIKTFLNSIATFFE